MNNLKNKIHAITNNYTTKFKCNLQKTRGVMTQYDEIVIFDIYGPQHKTKLESLHSTNQTTKERRVFDKSHEQRDIHLLNPVTSHNQSAYR